MKIILILIMKSFMIIINRFFKTNIKVLFLIPFLKNSLLLKFQYNIKNINIKIENVKDLLKIENLYFYKTQIGIKCIKEIKIRFLKILNKKFKKKNKMKNQKEC